MEPQWQPLPQPVPPQQLEQPKLPNHPPDGHHWKIIAAVAGGFIVVGFIVWLAFVLLTPTQSQEQSTTSSDKKPSLVTSSVVGGYDHIWDIAFLPTKEMLFNERSGKIHLRLNDGKVREIHQIEDVVAKGEGGLLGLEVDPKFSENNYIYACFNSSKAGADKADVRVARFKLVDQIKVEERTDIVTGMPTSGGRHSGCRIKFAPDGFLYVGTGDAAIGGTAADHKSLGGKILRVDRDGDPAPGNLGGDFDPRIYSYGHRNVQGLAFFPTAENAVLGVSVEHGSTEDDEINVLQKGNFGWLIAAGGYNETGVPMTDKSKDPSAVESIWSSGTPTEAPSGATFVTGNQWGFWNGALFVATLKGQHLKILTIESNNKVTTTENVLIGQFGRLRAVTQGPDGNLYISTDNGRADQIVRVTPQ